MAFPVPLIRFEKTIKGTPDEVYVGILRLFHRNEKHTVSEWETMLEVLKKS